MAVKFKKVKKVLLRNDAHFQFHTEFRDAVVRNGSVRTVPQVSPLWAKYLAAYTREDEGIKRIRKSALTERILTADRLRDDAFSGMAEQVNAHLKHFSAPKRSAAERLKILFATYGNVAAKSLSEETSAIYNLLQDLNGDKYLSDTESAGLLDWAAELGRLNKAFDALIKERDAETAESKQEFTLKAVRAELDGIYDNIVEVGEAHILLATESAGAFKALADAFNPVVDRYIKLLNSRRGRRGTGGDDEDGEGGDGGDGGENL